MSAGSARRRWVGLPASDESHWRRLMAVTNQRLLLIWMQWRRLLLCLKDFAYLIPSAPVQKLPNCLSVATLERCARDTELKHLRVINTVEHDILDLVFDGRFHGAAGRKLGGLGSWSSVSHNKTVSS